MKIFFVASIYGKERHRETYQKIVDILKHTGNKIIAGHILKTSKRDLEGWDNEKRIAFHKKVIDGVKRADMVVAEISSSSTSVGYLISLALECGKPAVVLYSGEKEPHILSTIEQADKLLLLKYSNLNELEGSLAEFVKDAANQMDVRFNFFISPKIGVYLDWISKNKKLPRAVFLRRLIEEHMAKNKEYKG